MRFLDPQLSLFHSVMSLCIFSPGHLLGVYSYDLQVHGGVSVVFKLLEFFDHAPDCSFKFCALGFISVILTEWGGGWGNDISTGLEDVGRRGRILSWPFILFLM